MTVDSSHGHNALTQPWPRGTRSRPTFLVPGPDTGCMARRRSDGRTVPGETPLWPGYVAAAWLAVVAVLWLAVDGPLPPAAAVTGVVSVLAALAVGHRASPETRLRALVAATALSVAAVGVATVTTPLAGVALPDIGVLGQYTYLATEIAFGGVTAALLARRGAETARSVGRTVAAVYPVAYVWDWYTLEVGVFAIPLRTGVELVGIPLEEHLFMIVVPGFVLAVHETLRGHSGESS